MPDWTGPFPKRIEKMPTRVYGPSPTLASLNDGTMSGFDVVPMAREIVIAQSPERAPEPVQEAPAVMAYAPVRAEETPQRATVAATASAAPPDDHVARALWEIYNQTGNPADFVRADHAKAGGRILQDQYPTHYLPHVGRQVMADGGVPSSEYATMQSYEPTMREKIVGWIKGTDTDKPTAARENFANGVGELLNFTPAGIPLSGQEAQRAGQRGDYVGAVANAMAMIPAVKPEVMALQQARQVMQAAPQGIKAYHGSPHTFDKFDMSKIGTGEGAQAYGHGLYFAENEAVAKGYRDALSSPVAKLDPTRINDELAGLTGFSPEAVKMARQELEMLKGDAGQTLSLLDGLYSNTGYGRAKEAAQVIRAMKPEVHRGSMYEVNINAHPEQFLDWDKSLNKQHPLVQEAFGKIPLTRDDTGGHIWQSLVAKKNAEGAFGEHMADPMPAIKTGPKAATEYLRDSGVPGIRYMDAFSRDKADGSRNYVVFNDKLIDINRRYAEGGEVNGVPEWETPRTYEDAQRVIQNEEAKRAAAERNALAVEAQSMQGPVMQQRMASMPQQPMTSMWTTPEQQNVQMNDAVSLARSLQGQQNRQEAKNALAQTWPVQMAKSAWEGAKLPGDVLAGRADPNSEESIKRAVDLAGLTMSGTMASPAPAGAVLGSGPVRQAATTYERQVTPMGLYSHGAETAYNLPQAKGTFEQMQAMLAKQGVKPDELAALQQFAGRPSVTREELGAALHGALPQVEERVLGGIQPTEFTVSSAGGPMRDYQPPARFQSRTEAEAELARRREQNPSGFHNIADLPAEGTNTKFEKLTLPGAENYREVLLKGPEKRTEKTFDEWAKNRGLSDGNTARAQYSKWLLENPDKGFAQFKSSHWDDPNVIAHLRMADRTGPNGEKILHLEELQSDWGQKGRKEGFKKPDYVVRNTKSGNSSIGFATKEEAEKYMQTLPQNMQPMLRVHERASSVNGVPTGPYVTNTNDWTDLALKRALREAAQGGYDKLVWTPGAEQAKRYDLSKHINEIEYIPNRDGTYRIGVADKNGGEVPLPNADKMTLEQIESTFGKEIAEKVKSNAGRKYRGHEGYTLDELNLQTGGEGMKGYYDNIVPKRLQQILKKLDPEARVGQQPINDIQAPAITITPKMRENILKGLPAYADGGTVIQEKSHVRRRKEIPGSHEVQGAPPCAADKRQDRRQHMDAGRTAQCRH